MAQVPTVTVISFCIILIIRSSNGCNKIKYAIKVKWQKKWHRRNKYELNVCTSCTHISFFLLYTFCIVSWPPPIDSDPAFSFSEYRWAHLKFRVQSPWYMTLYPGPCDLKSFSNWIIHVSQLFDATLGSESSFRRNLTHHTRLFMFFKCPALADVLPASLESGTAHDHRRVMSM